MIISRLGRSWQLVQLKSNLKFCCYRLRSLSYRVDQDMSRKPVAKRAPPSNDGKADNIVQSASKHSSSRKEKLISREPHVREEVNEHALHPDHRYLKVLSWNINGLRAVVSKSLHVVHNLVAAHNPDILLLQETKLQSHMVDESPQLLKDYEAFWHCSVDKLGYSGTAMLLKKSSFVFSDKFQHTPPAKPDDADSSNLSAKSKKKTANLSSILELAASSLILSASPTSSSGTTPPKPLLTIDSIRYGFEQEGREFQGEGRTMTLETSLFYLVNCYVPNSGEGLARLDNRVNQWDRGLHAYLHTLSQTKPVILAGDLNVGHLDLDMHNSNPKHVEKSACLTPQERASFGRLLVGGEGCFLDAFRYFYPTAVGQFTYWSMRAFNRPVNKGLRLDYFLASQDMFPAPSHQGLLEGDAASLPEEKSKKDSRKSTKVQTSGKSKRRRIDSGDGNEGPGSKSRDAIKGDDTDITKAGNIATESEDQPTASRRAARRAIEHEGVPIPGVADCYMLHKDTEGCSDHCPIVLTIRIG